MNDFTRKDAGVPIIGQKKNEGVAPVGDAWLHDTSAANLGILIRTTDDLMTLMGEEKIFCDMCGAEFPLWPIRQWAAHYCHDHRDEITMQHAAGFAALLTDDLTPAVQGWFQFQMMFRVTIRRRANDLGMIKWLPPNTSGVRN